MTGDFWALIGDLYWAYLDRMGLHSGDRTDSGMITVCIHVASNCFVSVLAASAVPSPVNHAELATTLKLLVPFGSTTPFRHSRWFLSYNASFYPQVLSARICLPQYCTYFDNSYQYLLTGRLVSVSEVNKFNNIYLCVWRPLCSFRR